jgi:hypothetical protein
VPIYWTVEEPMHVYHYYVVRNPAGQYLSRLSLTAAPVWCDGDAMALTWDNHDRALRAAEAYQGHVEKITFDLGEGES